MDEDDHIQLTMPESSEDVLAFGPWVNQTPLTVAPQLPLEVVMQLFKRLGQVCFTLECAPTGLTMPFRPRIILVEQFGTLVGLLTVKDILRFAALQEHAATPEPAVDTSGALQDVLEEVWSWSSERFEAVLDWLQRFGLPISRWR